MVQLDLPLEQLRTYRYPRSEPAGPEEFWERTLSASRAAGGAVTAELVETMLRTVTVHDATFPGSEGEPVPRGK